jgi:hypothetical protein
MADEHHPKQVYATRRRQLLIVASLVGIYVATVSLVFEPDPSTGIKPLPGDYLWVVIPGTIVLAVLIWRAMKARIETSDTGVDLVRVAGHESIPWSDIRGFEVHPTPGRQGFAVRIRRPDETLVTVRSEINVRPLRDRDEARGLARVKAEMLRSQLEGDRRSRRTSGTLGTSGTAGATAST